MRMRLPAPFALLGVLSLLSGCTTVGTISGTVSPADAPRPAPQEQESCVGHISAGRSVADAVVYVGKIGREANSRLPAPPESAFIQQEGLSFCPRILVVVAGTRVDFPNRDTVFHNVFSVSPANRFDLGRYGPGNTRNVVFRAPGPVNIYCGLHPKMSAFVLVVPNKAFARPDSLGRFTLPPLPAGRYVVNVWHPDYPAIRRNVTVPGGGHAELEVTLGS